VDRLPQGPRVLVGEQVARAVVVEQDMGFAPAERRGRERREHHARGGTEGWRPSRGGTERGPAPVVRADLPCHVAGVTRPIVLRRSGHERRVIPTSYWAGR